MESVVNFVTMLKSEIENITIYDDVGEDKYFIKPKTNFVIATYYKGTGLEEVTKKLEEYLDEANKNESNITCI